MTGVRNAAWQAGGVVTLLGVFVIWKIVADAQLVSPVFLPNPERVAASLVLGFTNGETPHLLAATAGRAFGGWLLASVLGIVLGTLIGMSPQIRAYLAPSLEALRPLPVSALVPVVVGILGFTEQMVLFVILFGALWPVLLSTVHGLASVEPRLYEVAGVLRLSRLKVIWLIALPSALPDIIAGMRVALTVSLILVVVGEIVGNQPGIGYSILLAQRAYQPAQLFAGIILLAALGYVSAAALDVLESRLLTWR